VPRRIRPTGLCRPKHQRPGHVCGPISAIPRRMHDVRSYGEAARGRARSKKRGSSTWGHRSKQPSVAWRQSRRQDAVPAGCTKRPLLPPRGSVGSSTAEAFSRNARLRTTSAAGVRSCPVMDRPRGRLRYKAPGYVTMHASTGEARMTPRESHSTCGRSVATSL